MKQQGMVEIKLHSVIDLITNSSTEIFVKSESSLEPFKELINELLKIWEPGKTWEDIFDIEIRFSKSSVESFLDYISYDEDTEDSLNDIFGNVTDEDERLKIFTEYLNAVNTGEKSEPDWWEEEHLETILVVTPKEPKYEKFGELLTTFLYSTECYEHSWG